VSTVAKTFSLCDCATHVVFHSPAHPRPLRACPVGPIKHGGHFTVGCTNASSIEGDESVAQEQTLARMVHCPLRMVHETVKNAEICRQSVGLRDSTDEKGGADRPQRRTRATKP
jgi:hypothetical protein